LLLQNRGFLRNLIPYCLILGGLIVYLTSAPFIIIEKLKIPPHLFGFTQLPIFSAYILGSIYLGRTKDEKMIKKLLVRGITLVFLAGALMLMPSYLIKNNLFLFIIPMVIYALGFSFCAAPLVNEVMSAATSTKGSAAAFLGFGMAMSCMLSSLLLGMIYNGTILSIASLMFFISAIASSIYFLRSDTVSIQSEQVG
jgi:DHA1 family bicyclomycin/chloramphenicol resistance-like MFS transporter